MTMIQIDLPEATEKAAREAGLLTPVALEQVLMDTIRRRAGQGLLEAARKIQALGIEPMTMEENDVEVKAVRAERRAREVARQL